MKDLNRDRSEHPWHVVPCKNAVFVGKAQGVHDQYADKQLTTIQKRICLVEFLIMVGLLFVKGASEKSEWGCQNKKTTQTGGFFVCGLAIFNPFAIFNLLGRQF